MAPEALTNHPLAFSSLSIHYGRVTMIRLAPAIALLPLALLAACGPNDNDPGPGGVTVSEARALDEAAQMIEQRRLPREALDSGGTPAPTGTATTTATPPAR